MPIVGRLAAASGPLIVSGQIDRLVVTDDAVLIADYKTDQSAPRAADDVPRPYLRQLALYRAVLAEGLSRIGRCAPPSSGPPYRN